LQKFLLLFSKKKRFLASLPRVEAMKIPALYAALLTLPVAAQAQTDWLTYGFDSLRSGHNPTETLLNATTVATLAQSWSFPPGPFELAIDPTIATSNALLLGQPVVAHAVNINGTSTDLVIAGDENAFLFALDANSTKPGGTVVWYNNLGRRTVAGCGGKSRIVGIQSAATVNRQANGGRGVVYIALNGAVHALDLPTGVELKNWPAAIPAIANAGTDGYTHDAINDVAGSLYVATSSNCDNPPYYGRVVRIDTKTAAPLATWYVMSGNATQPSLSGGGIWGQGGVAIDTAKGGVFLATGNAIADNAQTPYGESIVNLNENLSRINGSATPDIPPGDNDFGATPQVFQPAGCSERLLAVPNKIGTLVVDKVGAGGGLRVSQNLVMANDTGNFRGAVAWDPAEQLLLVTTPTDGPKPFKHGLSAMHVNARCSGFSLSWRVSPEATSGTVTDPFSPATSANGVVYFGVQGTSENQVLAVAAGGAAPGQVLWQSPALSGPIVAPPTVVNGRVFVASLGRITAFGLPK
jgi:hypothetical protein